MSWFYNLKIAVKLISAFVLVAMIAGVVGAIAITDIKKIESEDTKLYTHMTVPLNNLGDIATSFQRTRVDTLYMIAATSEEEINKYEDKVKTRKNEVTAASIEFANRTETDNLKAEYENFKNVFKTYETYLQKLAELAHEKKVQEAYALVTGDAYKAATAVQESIDRMQEMKVSDAKAMAEGNTRTADTSTKLMIGFIIAGMLIAILLGLYISGIISKPIRKLVGVANSLAVGNIKVKVEGNTKDEIGMLMKSFALMVENIQGQAVTVEKMAGGDLTVQVRVKSEEDLLGQKLKEMIESNNEILGSINASSEQVASGARQVSTSSQALSQGSTEQASSIEEITSSITQVAAQTKQNALDANKANELAADAKENAARGNVQMKEMLRSMEDINESSSSISKIIKVIDEIAFQTNILALNAAVEAARAGQHGKGFAVVAEEVRNLAARSANAAKETTVMIEGSIKKVDSGTRIANETAQALDSIVMGVAKAADLVANIASASNEQATGIAQINTAIEQVAQVVQTNSATAEECAAASQELSSQAELLKEAVSRYKLGRKNSKIPEITETLSPDMLQMIESMIERKNRFKMPIQEAPKLKINLSDQDFGKY